MEREAEHGLGAALEGDGRMIRQCERRLPHVGDRAECEAACRANKG